MEAFVAHPILIIIGVILVYAYALAAISTGARRGSREDSSDGFFFVILVPALNEQPVIARTLSNLLALSGDFLILIIDDSSDDGTVATVRLLADPRVRLLERTGAQARLGKAAALNAGYTEIQRLALDELHGAENVIVVVFDADTLVPPGFLQRVAFHFRDPKVAGVQSAVRMYNDGQSLLTRLQHCEFVVWNEIFCRAKDKLGSATLGGNGQCVRLSALTALAGDPWQSALTEDLDLSLRLSLNNFAVRFCASVAVQQEALGRFNQLIRQRGRWVQGHLASWRHIPGLLRSCLPLRTRLDMTIFLILPALVLPVGLASISSWIGFWLDSAWSLRSLLGLYLVGFGMGPLAAYALWRSGSLDIGRAVAYGHLLSLYSWVWFVAFLVAYWNIICGRRAWVKTSRAGTWSLIKQGPDG